MKKSTLAALAGALSMAVATHASAETAKKDAEQCTTMQNGKCVKTKAAEGKCGEGKCGGAATLDTKTKAAEGKCGEGKCGGDAQPKAAEGKCGGTPMKPKADEGKCGGSK